MVRPGHLPDSSSDTMDRHGRGDDVFARMMKEYEVRRVARRRELLQPDSVMTLMLSTLSATLGVFVFYVAVMGLFGIASEPWVYPEKVITRKFYVDGMSWYYFDSGGHPPFLIAAPE